MDDDPPPPREDKSAPPPPQPPEAGMSYVAYFRGDKEDAHRPITFLYNGGPGSSTVWLHMGAFGPKRVVTADDTHSPAAPYRLIDNEYSLLDVERSGVHRCARHGLRPSAGSGQGEGLLRRRSGCPCIREFHRGVPFAAQPLEFAEVSVRRKLRNDALRGACLHPAEREIAGPERHHSAVADTELRRQRRCAAVQPRRGSALRTGAAHVHGHGVVSPQASQSARRARAAAARGGEFRVDRLFAGTGGGRGA